MTMPEQKKIRSRHADAMLDVIASLGECTRAQIAEGTGLSLMSVGRLADALAESGFTAESKMGGGRPGRHAGAIRLSDERLLVLVWQKAELSLYTSDWGGKVQALASFSDDGSSAVIENAVQEFFMSCGMPAGAVLVSDTGDYEKDGERVGAILGPMFGERMLKVDRITAAGTDAIRQSAGTEDELLLFLVHGERIGGRLFLDREPLGEGAGDYTELWKMGADTVRMALKIHRILETEPDPASAASGAAILLRRYLLERDFT